MSNYQDSPNQGSGQSLDIRKDEYRLPPPEPSKRWRSILANVGLWGGAAIAVLWMIVNGFGNGRGETKLIVLIGVCVGGGLGWVIGFLIDGMVTAAQASSFAQSEEELEIVEDEP